MNNVLPTSDETIARVVAERDEARAELAALREAIAKDGGAAGFFLAAWKSANQRNAELLVELERERVKLEQIGWASDTAVGLLDRQRERIAALELELAKERERTAGMLGAEVRP